MRRGYSPVPSGSFWHYRPSLAAPEAGPAIAYTSFYDLTDVAIHLLSSIGENYLIRLNEMR